MYQSLVSYRYNEKVWCINGYTPNLKIKNNEKFTNFFSTRSISWGWATWKDKWCLFNRNKQTLADMLNNSDDLNLVNKSGNDLELMSKLILADIIDSWAVYWSVLIIKNGGLCCNPILSKIENIGFDGSGTHSTEVNKFIIDINAKEKKLPYSQSFVIDENYNAQIIELFKLNFFGRVKLFIINTPIINQMYGKMRRFYKNI